MSDDYSNLDDDGLLGAAREARRDLQGGNLKAGLADWTPLILELLLRVFEKLVEREDGKP